MERVPDATGQVRSAPVKALRGFFAGVGQLLITADRFRAEEARRERAQDEQEREQEDAQRALAAQHAQTAQHALTQHAIAEQHALAEQEQVPREESDDNGGGTTGRHEPLTAPRASAAARRGRDARAGRHRATGLQGPAASAQAPTRRFRSLDSTGNVRLLTPDETVGDPDEDQPVPGRGQATAPVPAPRPVVAAGTPTAGMPAAAGTPAAAAPAVPVRPASLPVPGYDQLTLASLRSRLRYLDAAQLRVLADYEKATANRADVVGMFERRIAKLQAAAAHAT